MTLGTSGANLVDLTIRIHMVEMSDMFLRGQHDTLPPLHLFDNYLMGDHPIIGGLFSLKAVKRLFIGIEDEARFEPGFANALKVAFMKEGTANGRSITIKKGCTFPHDVLEEEEPCPGCGNTTNNVYNGTADWEYKDDMVSYQAFAKFLSLGGELKKGKSTKANSKSGTAAKAKQPNTKAAATKPTRPAKQTKAKPAKPSSKNAA